MKRIVQWSIDHHWIVIGLSVLLLIIYFTQIRKFQTGSVSLSCLFVFAILAGFIMAARGV